MLAFVRLSPVFSSGSSSFSKCVFSDMLSGVARSIAKEKVADAELTLRFYDHCLCVSYGSCTFYVNYSAVKFPDYRSLAPESFPLSFCFSLNDLYRAVERLSVSNVESGSRVFLSCRFDRVFARLTLSNIDMPSIVSEENVPVRNVEAAESALELLGNGGVQVHFDCSNLLKVLGACKSLVERSSDVSINVRYLGDKQLVHFDISDTLESARSQRYVYLMPILREYL